MCRAWNMTAGASARACSGIRVAPDRLRNTPSTGKTRQPPPRSPSASKADSSPRACRLAGAAGCGRRACRLAVRPRRMQVIFAPDCREAFERAGPNYPERELEPGHCADSRRTAARTMPPAGFESSRPGRRSIRQLARRERLHMATREGRPAAQSCRACRYPSACRGSPQGRRSRAREVIEKAQGRPLQRGRRPRRPKGTPTYPPRASARISPERAGWLVVPVLDQDGAIQSVQSVSPTGEKRFMPGGKMASGRCWIGEPSEAGPLVLCEGTRPAQAFTATGWPVCVTFTAGNLRAVACDVRERLPARQAGDCWRRRPRDRGQPWPHESP